VCSSKFRVYRWTFGFTVSFYYRGARSKLPSAILVPALSLPFDMDVLRRMEREFDNLAIRQFDNWACYAKGVFLWVLILFTGQALHNDLIIKQK
ncbi:MAG TPA: hypothetical protein VGD33_02680, partial [Chitinophagaceae bacterium]